MLDLSACEALHTAHIRGYVSNALEARAVLTQMVNTARCTTSDTQAVILEFFARPEHFECLYERAGCVSALLSLLIGDSSSHNLAGKSAGRFWISLSLPVASCAGCSSYSGARVHQALKF